MKLRSVAFADLTNSEIKHYLQHERTVLIPVGATEIHGEHAPLGTDSMIATHVCYEVAKRCGWLVAPQLSYGVSSGWKGQIGLVYIKPSTFLAVVKDLCLSLTEIGFRHIVFVNGHLPNSRPLIMACLEVSESLPSGCLCYGLSYWDGMTHEQLDEFLSLNAGLHANVGETSVMMAIKPELVDLRYARAHWPEIPQVNPSAVLDAVFETRVGGSNGVCPQGVWGDPTQATRIKGEKYIQQLTDGLEKLLLEVINIGKKHAYLL